MENGDEARYKELNTYFRIRIEQLLRQDEYLKDKLKQGHNLQVKDIVAHMSADDQERWQEFLELDQLKMQADIWNHLHGRGTPYQPGTGFSNPEDTTW